MKPSLKQHAKNRVALHPEFVVDAKGSPRGVILGIVEYDTVLEQLEELEAIKAYDRAKTSGDAAIPFEQAVAEIERGRK